MHIVTRAIRTLAALALVLPFAAGLSAQTYPTKPVRVIVPFAPGGGADAVGRLVGQKLGDALGQQLVIENRAGGGGAIGAAAVAKAAADGYVLLLGTDSIFTIIPHTSTSLPYDAQKDLTPVGLVAALTLGIAVHPAVPANTLQALIDHARARPDALSFGSAGNASPMHLAGALLEQRVGLKMAHVPYKGAAPAVNDLIAGQIPVAIVGLPPLLPQAKAGRIRILAVADAERSRAAPDVPTVAETVPGFQVASWFGLFAPARTPNAIVDRLSAELSKALAQTDLAAGLAAQGLRVEPAVGRDRFAAQIRAESERWAKLIATAGIKVEP